MRWFGWGFCGQIVWKLRRVRHARSLSPLVKARDLGMTSQGGCDWTRLDRPKNVAPLVLSLVRFQRHRTGGRRRLHFKSDLISRRSKKAPLVGGALFLSGLQQNYLVSRLGWLRIRRRPMVRARGRPWEAFRRRSGSVSIEHWHHGAFGFLNKCQRAFGGHIYAG